jgi:hypothetical protein
MTYQVERRVDERGTFVAVAMKHDEFLLLDEPDWEWARQWLAWYAVQGKTTFYCARRRILTADGPGPKAIRLHRVLLLATDAEHVDHEDGNGMNHAYPVNTQRS